MILPDAPTRTDSEAYVYLCNRPDVREAWAKAAREYPAAPPSALAVIVRASGTPIDASLATSFHRIYYASQRKSA